MKKLLILSIIGWLVLSSSCKKEESTATPNNNSNRELLTAKSWNVTALSLNGKDIYKAMAVCDKDDIHLFKADGTYIADEGATKCSSSNPQIISQSTWELKDNETRIIFDGDTAKIIELNATLMVLRLEILGEISLTTYTAQ